MAGRAVLIVAELFELLRRNMRHGESIRETFLREVHETTKSGPLLRLRCELDAMREAIDRRLIAIDRAAVSAVAPDVAIVRGDLVVRHPALTEDAIVVDVEGGESHQWRYCDCGSCRAARRAFERQVGGETGRV